MRAASAITWFEIPSKDLDRATRFYEDVHGAKAKYDPDNAFHHNKNIRQERRTLANPL
jgi:predicted enzyme related to lactoylglutathione lyase